MWFSIYWWRITLFLSLSLLLSIALDNYKEVSFLGRPKKAKWKEMFFFYWIIILKNWHVFKGCLYYIQISIFINLACWFWKNSLQFHDFLMLINSCENKNNNNVIITSPPITKKNGEKKKWNIRPLNMRPDILFKCQIDEISITISPYWILNA